MSDLPGKSEKGPLLHRSRAAPLGMSRDYAEASARLENATTYQWLHPLGEIVMSLLDVGLTLRWLHEHESLPWRMFERLIKDDAGLYRWPDQPWLPLAFSLRAERSRG
jgi:hypothetical protein